MALGPTSAEPIGAPTAIPHPDESNGHNEEPKESNGNPGASNGHSNGNNSKASNEDAEPGTATHEPGLPKSQAEGKMSKFPIREPLEDKYAEREYQKGRLALAFRIFAKHGYDEGVAGHITLRVFSILSRVNGMMDKC